MPIQRPALDEHLPYAAKYVQTAADALSRDGLTDISELLAQQPAALTALLSDVSPKTAQSAYAAGKWTLLESLLHTVDTERVFAYRLLRAARGDRTPLPGFEQDDWVPASGANRRSVADLLNEFLATRASTLALLKSMDENDLAGRTVAGGHDVSARALAWLIAGHTEHHLILTRDRYLNG